MKEDRRMAKPRKSFKTTLSKDCEGCGSQVNLHLVSMAPPIWRGTCESCGTRAEGTGDQPREKQVIGYLRVSSQFQDLDKNKADILSFANERKLGHVTWVEEKVSGVKTWRKREIAKAVESLSNDDWLIVPELSRLGRSTLDILEVLSLLREKGVNVYALKGNWSLNGTIEAKVFVTMMALFAEIERDLISARTKEALKARKAAGVQLGRPKGPGKSKLDQYRPEIESLLKTGSTLKYIAKRYGSSEANLLNWLKKNKIDRKPDYGVVNN
jgi:DNA invertase Pin-like site-specific DNA recombinase